MNYLDIVCCERCGKIVRKDKTRHFCETTKEYNESWSWSLLRGYKKNKSKGFWVE